MKTAILIALLAVSSTSAARPYDGGMNSGWPWSNPAPVRQYRTPVSTNYYDSNSNFVGSSKPNVMGGKDYYDSTYQYQGRSTTPFIDFSH